MSHELPSVPPSVRNVRRKPPVASEGKGDDAGATSAARAGDPARAERLVRGLWTALGTVVVVGIGAVATWGARHYIQTSPRFAIEAVEVSGARHRTAAELETEAGLVKGQNVFSVDLDASRDRLLADPWIREASVARKLPSSIALRVTEHEAAALVVAGADTYLATRDGELFKRLEPGDPTDLDVVTGLSVDMLAADRDGAVAVIRRALDLAAEYTHSALAARSPLQEIHVESNGEMTLVIGKSTVALHMGGAPYRKKIEHAIRVLSELDRRGAKADEIMLDDDARPDRVVVRMR